MELWGSEDRISLIVCMSTSKSVTYVFVAVSGTILLFSALVRVAVLVNVHIANSSKW